VEHIAADFTPVSRFAREELQEAIKEMELLVAQQDSDGEGTEMGGPSEFEASWTCATMEDAAAPSAGISAEANSHPTCVIPYHALTEPLFQRVWSEGNPLVVTGILEQMQLKWDPAFFIDNYGDQSATLTDCNSETTRKKSIRDFFSWFGNYEDRDKRCWKLKVRLNLHLQPTSIRRSSLSYALTDLTLGLATLNGFQDRIPRTIRRF
jgi:[histone H3]-dimethyl-L-lysine9 demethylase